MFTLLIALSAQAHPPAEAAPIAPPEKTQAFTRAEDITLDSIKASPKGQVVGTCGSGKAKTDVTCTHVEGNTISCAKEGAKHKEATWIGGTDPFHTVCD